jgi:hypothetical protein
MRPSVPLPRTWSLAAGAETPTPSWPANDELPASVNALGWFRSATLVERRASANVPDVVCDAGRLGTRASGTTPKISSDAFSERSSRPSPTK